MANSLHEPNLHAKIYYMKCSHNTIILGILCHLVYKYFKFLSRHFKTLSLFYIA
jgi:hypothetical protein